MLNSRSIADPIDPELADATAGSSPLEANSQPAVHMHNPWIVLIALMAALWFMHWAQAFLVPLLFAILLSYAMGPPVSFLERWHVPRALGALLIMGMVVAVCVTLVYSLGDDAASVTEMVPKATNKLRTLARAEGAGGGTKPLANLRKAATELDKAAAEATGAPAPPPRPAPAPQETGVVQQWLVAQTAHAAQRVVELGMALLLTYFLLSAGDAFRRKIARIAGPTIARRRVAVTMLNEIDGRIQRYLAIIVLTNALIAAATWAILAAIGIEHALFWGVVAGVLHLIPYVGSAATAIAVCVIALAQLNEVWDAVLAAVAVLTVATAIGMFLTTWLQARACKMNSVVVIVGVVFFGWLWGGWGLILAVPMITVVKTIADGVEEWQPLAEILAGEAVTPRSPRQNSS